MGRQLGILGQLSRTRRPNAIRFASFDVSANPGIRTRRGRSWSKRDQRRGRPAHIENIASSSQRTRASARGSLFQHSGWLTLISTRGPRTGKCSSNVWHMTRAVNSVTSSKASLGAFHASGHRTGIATCKTQRHLLPIPSSASEPRCRLGCRPKISSNGVIEQGRRANLAATSRAARPAGVLGITISSSLMRCLHDSKTGPPGNEDAQMA
jgi:hypothetical protein